MKKMEKQLKITLKKWHNHIMIEELHVDKDGLI